MQTDRLLSPAEVAARTSLSITTIWRLRKAGQFPEAVPVTTGRVAFSEAAVDAWIRAKLDRPAA